MINPSEAAKELLARRRARSGLAGYCEYLMPQAPAEHHLYLIAALERLERGEIDRLLVCMPPGSAKSTYSSVAFPSWYLAKNPTKSVIAASHTADLVEGFGRRARNLMASKEHQNLYEVQVAADSSAAGRWATTSGGGYYAVGVGGSVTGRRADLMIVDDPIRGREDADSERVRAKTWDWYVNDLLTRAKPECKIVVAATRWHEDDLMGRILEREPERWTIICLPMLAGVNDPLGRSVGERLWPEWYTEEMVATAQLDVRSWNALYQQEPAAEDGEYFKHIWMTEYDDAPKDLHIYGASDYAVTDGGGDYTEHGIFGVDHNGNIYVLDWWRGQTAADVWIEEKCNLIRKHQPLCWFGEAGPIRRSVEPFMLKRMDERNAHCRIEWLASINDKTARARSIQARMSMGKVFFPKYSAWKADIVAQLVKFPVGKHDDAVDVFSLIGRGLEYIKDVRKKATKPKPERRVSTTQSWMG